MRKIAVSDYTLREMTENGGASLLFREKTAVAACIDAFGADAVELPQIRRVREDTIVAQTIAASVRHSTVCMPAGDTEEDVENAWNCVKNAAHPRLQISLPVSTVTMEYTYHCKEDKMAEKIAALCKKARTFCDDVEFSAGDATRADRAFLIRAVRTAAESGATVITVCDDAGICLPEELASLVQEVKEACALPLYIRITDEVGMGNAAAFYALRAGADGVKTAISGEHALNTANFTAAVAARGESYGFTTALKTTELQSDIHALLKKLHRPAQEENAESRTDIFLDAGSTMDQVDGAARSLGYSLSAEDNGKVYRALMTVCERKRAVGAKELEAIIASNAMQAPSVYHLSSYSTTSSNISPSMANVILQKDDEMLTGVATGDGPIDAAFRAIETCVGFHYELDAFQIEAVTEGKEALGSAVVRLRNGWKLYSGNGLSTDIVGASIRAYINALNKIVSEEEQI